MCEVHQRQHVLATGAATAPVASATAAVEPDVGPRWHNDPVSIAAQGGRRLVDRICARLGGWCEVLRGAHAARIPF
ncbi:MAG: hypothetical protein JWN88_2791 [Frankiales bacterium]|nr:hypothetical protein [Frankiales bacterium]